MLFGLPSIDLKFWKVMFKSVAVKYWYKYVKAEGIEILKGVVISDYVHMHIEYAPKQNVSAILKSLKGRISRKLQIEYPEL